MNDDSAQPAMSGPDQAPANGGAAKQLVLLLHGVGSNGDDLIALAPLFAQVLPDAHFIAPNAPYPCDMVPMGMGYQWFDIMTQEAAERLHQLHAVAKIVDSYIDGELARLGLADNDLALIGFSQGTMISLHVSLRRAAACAGILGYSGRLEAPETLAGEIKSRPPVMLIHGEMDDRLPVVLMESAAATMQENGVRVKTHRRPHLGHSIDQEGVALGAGFLTGIFA